ncbi:MAG: DUF1580 domain-containing protein [Alphaproteobacteria bacterium]
MELSDCLPIVQAVESVIGHRPHIQSIRRWIKKGVRGVKLEASYVNGKYLTSTSAVHEFIKATTEARLQVTEAPKIDIPKSVKPARVNAAIKEFERMTKPAKAKS